MYFTLPVNHTDTKTLCKIILTKKNLLVCYLTFCCSHIRSEFMAQKIKNITCTRRFLNKTTQAVKKLPDQSDGVLGGVGGAAENVGLSDKNHKRNKKNQHGNLLLTRCELMMKSFYELRSRANILRWKLITSATQWRPLPRPASCRHDGNHVAPEVQQLETPWRTWCHESVILCLRGSTAQWAGTAASCPPETPEVVRVGVFQKHKQWPRGSFRTTDVQSAELDSPTPQTSCIISSRSHRALHTQVKLNFT